MNLSLVAALVALAFAAYLRGFETRDHRANERYDDELGAEFAAYLRGFETQHPEWGIYCPDECDPAEPPGGGGDPPGDPPGGYEPFAAYLRGFETGEGGGQVSAEYTGSQPTYEDLKHVVYGDG